MESAMTRALTEIRRATGMTVAFGGMLDARGGSYVISHTVGGTTRALNGLRIRAGEGLGGRALIEAKPASVADYLNDSRITHPYDLAVSAESLRSIVAVPVLVQGSVKAVLYGALRVGVPIGPIVVDGIQAVCSQLAFGIAVAEETERRMRALETTAIIRQSRSLPARAEWESVRRAHIELRELTREVDDEVMKKRLTSITARLECSVTTDAPKLTERETDVLSLVSLGLTNGEVATRLGVGSETVKSYLRNAARKLGVHRRMEAVSRARSLGILP